MSTLEWLRQWAWRLDSQFRIPGTSIRFGLDPILSLIPGVGDLASPIYTVLLLVRGVGQRVPRVVLVRMALNALIDALVGAVPLAGNVADVFWRANTRNLALLERHARPGLPPARGDYYFVFAVAAIFGVLLVIPFVLAIALAWMLWAYCC